MNKEGALGSRKLATGFKKRKASPFGMIVAIAWCFLASAFTFFYPTVLENLNARFYDWKMSLATPPETAPQVVHVDVDDIAIKKFGLWPWDRALSATMVRHLSEMGAKVIVFDVLYRVPGKSEESDQAFFDAIKDANNVISASAPKITNKAEVNLKVTGDRGRVDAFYGKSWLIYVPRFFRLFTIDQLDDLHMPLKEIILNSKELGHIIGTPDADGVFRKIPLLLRLEERCVPHLTLAALKVYWNLAPESIRLDKTGTLEVVRAGQALKIPIDALGRMQVNWGKTSDNFPAYSVAEVLKDNRDAADFSRYKDKIVIIGYTATGGTDVGITPKGIATPLSRIHSHVISSILTGNFITRISPFPYPVVIALILGIVFSIASLIVRFRLMIIVAVVTCFAAFACSLVSFTVWAHDIPMSEFFLIFLPAMSASMVWRMASMELQASRVSRALEKYLSPEILEQVVGHGMDLDLSTKRQELTVLFVDIEGFSTLSETVEVEYINQFLNDFFDRMTQAIFSCHGTVDKFLGDGLLAFFGDPIPLENHALAAVNASIKMQEQMAQLSHQWSKSGRSGLDKTIHIRIGINTGLVVVGNIGSSRRLEYTVLGSTVNIASRLQSLARPGGVIMTARTWALVRDHVECVGPEHVRVKGIDRDIAVYRLDIKSKGLGEPNFSREGTDPR